MVAVTGSSRCPRHSGWPLQGPWYPGTRVPGGAVGVQTRGGVTGVEELRRYLCIVTTCTTSTVVLQCTAAMVLGLRGRQTGSDSEAPRDPEYTSIPITSSSSSSTSNPDSRRASRRTVEVASSSRRRG
eukprot:762557-Rhodomonas_salina.2